MEHAKPNAEQLRALKQYAAEHGRNWKAALRADWETASAQIGGETSAELQQVRNVFGPAWLGRFNLTRVV